MLYRSDLHPYQRNAVPFMRDRPAAACWLDMGLGKTVITLTAVADLLLLGEADMAFIFAPIRVIQTVWRQEAKKWDQTKHLKFSLVYGTEKQRCDALRKRADVYLVNYENTLWFLRVLRTMPGFPKGIRVLILDESSKMKAPNTKRFKAMKKMLPEFKVRWELTGTPAPNSYRDIFSQIFLLDGGQRFGNRADLFREEFFKKDDYMGYSYSIRPGAQQRIERAIAPLVLRLDARDYKAMPPVTYNPIMLDLPVPAMAQYKELEKEFFLQLEAATVEVFFAAALTAKLWQFANGALYDTEKNWHAVHDAKLNALEDLLDEAGGTPVLIAYWFKSDLARLRDRLGADVPVFSETKDLDALLDKWARKEIPYLLIHPASGGHGIDRLQHGGHILAMYSQTWSLEMHDQLVARLNRQGQKHPVIVHYLLANHTVDLAIYDAIRLKSRNQTQLLDALRRYHLAEELLS